MPLALTTINIGTTPGDNTGNPARTAFQTVNTNFALVAGAMEDAELKAFVVGCTAKGEDLTVDTTVEHFHMPYAFVLLEVQASVETAPVGASVLVDVLENGYSVLASAELAVAAGAKFGFTDAVPYTILEKGSEITFDVTQVGSTTPGQWLKVSLIGYVIWTSF